MKIELCVGSYEALDISTNLNIDRIELCQCLEFGGISPSIAMLQEAKRIHSIPIQVLIRPNLKGFLYSNLEKKIILKEIENQLKHQADGIVIGALRENKEPDLDFLQQIITLFPNIEFTFHRAFDLIPNKQEATLLLHELGFKRILTSGSQTNISKNINELKNLCLHAKNKIEIMLGGGINQLNVSELVNKIKPNAVHFSGTSLIKNNLPKKFEQNQYLEFSLEKTKEILSEIEKITKPIN